MSLCVQDARGLWTSCRFARATSSRLVRLSPMSASSKAMRHSVKRCLMPCRCKKCTVPVIGASHGNWSLLENGAVQLARFRRATRTDIGPHAWPPQARQRAEGRDTGASGTALIVTRPQSCDRQNQHGRDNHSNCQLFPFPCSGILINARNACKKGRKYYN